jgi:hypothetical protein
MTFASPIAMLAAGAVFVLALVVAGMRRPAMPRSALLLLLLGMLLLTIACGRPRVKWPEPRRVAVLVDQSASTRTAGYRDQSALQQRIAQLIGDTPHEIIPFSSAAADSTSLLLPSPLPDAVLLFSDGQFVVPQSTMAPTFPVVDAQLERPADASVRRMELRDDDRVAIAISNNGNERQLQAAATTLPAPPGAQVLAAPLAPDAQSLTASLNPGDAWPENDALTLQRPPPASLERWWVGAAAPQGWRVFDASDLPTNAAAYLAASAVVLNNIPADALPQTQQECLAQYPRALGGGLVLLGGDRAFGAGGYLGTPLEQVSPLSVAAPEPQRHWILLIDASGSMAAELQPGFTRFNRAALSMTQLLGNLPPNDLVSIASFSTDLTWWVEGQTVEAARKLPLPPTGIRPRGATNLEPVLDAVTMRWVTLSRLEVIVASDADATFEDAAGLTARLRARQARVSLLATADPSRSPVLRIVALTGGNVATELNPLLWAEAAKKLARAALPNRVEQIPVRISFADKLQSLAPREVSLWNRTWLKKDATALASAGADASQTPMAAIWRVGAGAVAAAAFAPTAEEAQALVGLVQRPPRDPRFAVAHEIGEALQISVTAADGQQPLNEQALILALSDLSSATPRLTNYPIPQTAPGRYEAALPAPRFPALATVRLGETVIDRFAVAGRYPAEFDAIGNNRDTMQALASATGGRVIEPTQTSPIDFAWPIRIISLMPWLALAGAALLGLGLARWKAKPAAR